MCIEFETWPTTTLTRIPTHTHTWSPRYSTDFISSSLTPRRFYSFNSHRYPITQSRVHLHFWQPALVRSPTTKPSSPAGFSANGLHVHDSIPSVPPSFLLERERERERLYRTSCVYVRMYTERALVRQSAFWSPTSFYCGERGDRAGNRPSW